MRPPVRLSGRRRQAYRPVPMKLQPTAGPKIAQTALASLWSLASTIATTPAPAASAARTTARLPAAVMSGSLPRIRTRASAPGPLGRGLDQPERVAGRVAEAGIDAVGTFGGLLGELDAAGLELLVGGPAVLGPEDEAARSALRHDLLHLVGGRRVEHGRSGHVEGEGDVRLADGADREPAVAAELGQGHVLAQLEAELLGVEGERLVLVVDPDVRVSEVHGHERAR